MISQLPLFISIGFILCTLYTFLIFGKATAFNKTYVGMAIAWIVLQSALALSSFYLNSTGIPPRIFLSFVPTIFLMIGLFVTKSGRSFLDGLNQKWLTLLHTVRIPVEFILLSLFLYGFIPKTMTFEGLNFDIVAGILGLVVFILGYWKNRI